MSNDTVISVENLSKVYLIGHDGPRESYQSLRDTLVRHGKNYVRKAIDMARGRQIIQGDTVEEFWALKDVSFEVKRGEVLGIIGRNGAGKSTLLKILSRITEPTEGKVTLNGRVASLLEVGTGFHPELSGRENIFLNGAILGMGRTEIKAKFDEIVDFAGVEKFLDTPVKRYSSGMYVRLAFAVAAHLEPEILIVDEVLAVGDAEFQKRCLKRMNEISDTGQTVIFVSHNLEALRSICQKGLLLKAGRVNNFSDIQSILNSYNNTQAGMSCEFPADSAKPSITKILIDQERLARGDLSIELHYQSPFPLKDPVGGVVVVTPGGQPLFGTNMRLHPPLNSAPASVSGICALEIPGLPLHSGKYNVNIWLGDQSEDYDFKSESVSFEFVSPSHYANRPPLHIIGSIDLPCKWVVR